MSTATVSSTLFVDFDERKDKVQLDAKHRCDRCSAQAYVRATLRSGGTLMFCAHHATEHKAALAPLCSEWYSETGRLTEDRKRGSEN